MKTSTSWIVIPAVLATGITCTLFFEQARWLWHRKKRVSKLRRKWRNRQKHIDSTLLEQLQNESENDEIFETDEIPRHLECEHCAVSQSTEFVHSQKDINSKKYCNCTGSVIGLPYSECHHRQIGLSLADFDSETSSSSDENEIFDNSENSPVDDELIDSQIAENTRSVIKKRREINDKFINNTQYFAKRATDMCEHMYESICFAGRFVNPFPEWRDKNATNFWEYLTWRFVRKDNSNVPKDETILEKTLPVVQPNWDLISKFNSESDTIKLDAESESYVLISGENNHKEDNEGTMTVTWFGQSSCLVQMDGYNIMTDPMFSTRTLGEWFGPKRLRPPPCKIEDIPIKIDLVLISHDHYDHLDKTVVKYLGNDVKWFIPLGLKEWFQGLGVSNVIELDWWQEATYEKQGLEALKIVATPIQHWSGRHFFDVNSTLWSSFVVKGKRDSLFHCGDTGYCNVFQDIGHRYGPISLALLPIGSYSPRWFMRHQHIDPEEATRIHIQLQAKRSLGVHWGTFVMSDEYYLEPPRLLAKAREAAGLTAESTFTTQIGQTMVI